MKLIKNVQIYAPENLGIQDVLISDTKIEKIAKNPGGLPRPPGSVTVSIRSSPDRSWSPARRRSASDQGQPCPRCRRRRRYQYIVNSQNDIQRSASRCIPPARAHNF